MNYRYRSIFTTASTNFLSYEKVNCEGMAQFLIKQELMKTLVQNGQYLGCL